MTMAVVIVIILVANGSMKYPIKKYFRPIHMKFIRDDQKFVPVGEVTKVQPRKECIGDSIIRCRFGIDIFWLDV